MDVTEQWLARAELEKALQEIKERSEALRRSESYLAEAQRMTRSGSWAWNVRTGAIFWSQEMFRIYDYDPEKMKPTWSHILERVHPEDRSKVEQRAERETAQKESVGSEGDFRIVLPDGTTKHLHSIAHPVMDESGEVIEVVGTVMDVTEHRRLERELQHERDRLRLLLNLNNRVASHLDLRQVFQAMSSELRRVFSREFFG